MNNIGTSYSIWITLYLVGFSLNIFNKPRLLISLSLFPDATVAHCAAARWTSLCTSSSRAISPRAPGSWSELAARLPRAPGSLSEPAACLPRAPGSWSDPAACLPRVLGSWKEPAACLPRALGSWSEPAACLLRIELSEFLAKWFPARPAPLKKCPYVCVCDCLVTSIWLHLTNAFQECTTIPNYDNPVLIS